ncbi:hypothetical protein [Rhizobium sp. BK491]|nr:hypothetical protein [Rhizobium sp. BK491]MBB3569730.1 hypothetical protein [Rhizobium sp. BK491]
MCDGLPLLTEMSIRERYRSPLLVDAGLVSAPFITVDDTGAGRIRRNA